MSIHQLTRELNPIADLIIDLTVIGLAAVAVLYGSVVAFRLVSRKWHTTAKRQRTELERTERVGLVWFFGSFAAWLGLLYGSTAVVGYWRPDLPGLKEIAGGIVFFLPILVVFLVVTAKELKEKKLVVDEYRKFENEPGLRTPSKRHSSRQPRPATHP